MDTHSGNVTLSNPCLPHSAMEVNTLRKDFAFYGHLSLSDFGRLSLTREANRRSQIVSISKTGGKPGGVSK